MSDFTPDELFEAIDRQVQTLLERYGFLEPPVDAQRLAIEAFGLTIREQEPDADSTTPGRFGPRAPKRRAREIVLRFDQSEESRHALCARACAREMVPEVLTRLGIAPGTENRSALNQFVGLIAPRLLAPTRWFGRDAHKLGADLFQLKDRYSTAGYELLAARLLELDEPCVIAIVDDGLVSSRRGNRAPMTKKLTPTEQLCLTRVVEESEPQIVRRDGWTVQGWPIPTGPFNRIILRAVPDDVY